MITITIQRKYSVWEKTRNWLQVSNDSGRNFDYVDAELPVEKSVLLLQQSIEDEATFDVAKVIKAVNGL